MTSPRPLPQRAPVPTAVHAGTERATSPSARRIGVVLVEPLHAVRAALALLISSEPGIEVVAEASSGAELLAAFRQIRRRHVVVVLALTIADRDPFPLIREIRERFPSIAVLAMGSDSSGGVISRALFFGADGFVCKASEPREFIEAIQLVRQGETALLGVPPEALGAVAADLETRGQTERLLTEREREVLTAASHGLTARQIGRQLGVEERTVSTHLGRIYKKLGASGRLSAVSMATRYGLVASVLE